MNPWRWLLTGVSFALCIGASVYIVLTSWTPASAPAAIPLSAHAMAVAAVLLEIITRAGKIKLSAISLGIPVRFETAVRTSLGGDFGASITPARTGAEPARFLILAEAGTPTAGVLLLLFAEVFLEVLSLTIIVGAFALLLRDGGATLDAVAGMIGAHAMVILGIGAAGVLIARGGTGGPTPSWLERLGLDERRWHALQRWLAQLRASILALRHARWGIALLSLGASLVHVLMRLAILPILVYGVGVVVPLAPLLLWPIALLYYGGVVAPVPGGGGFVEIAFRATLGGAIPPRIFGAALIWWRFYTFYAYVLLGALAAGGTVLRALRNGRREDVGGLPAAPGESAARTT